MQVSLHAIPAFTCKKFARQNGTNMFDIYIRPIYISESDIPDIGTPRCQIYVGTQMSDVGT